jgi:hypothetical protein
MTASVRVMELSGCGHVTHVEYGVHEKRCSIMRGRHASFVASLLMAHCMAKLQSGAQLK